jgi:GNAT superfamily N-acetyltransferase
LNIRKPTICDVPALYDCILPYAGKSRQGSEVAVDMATVLQSLVNVVEADNFVALMCEIDGQAVGLAFGYHGCSWWKEPDCAVDFFYVDERHTCRGIARALVAGIILEFKARGCGWMYAGAESDISETNTRLYENLFRKFGFRDIGGGRMILNLRGL